MNLSMHIDQVDAQEMSRSKFKEFYLSTSKPLILKGFANLYPAGKLWSFEYLNQIMGNHVIGIFDNSKKTNTAYVNPQLEMTFSEFSDIIQRDEETPYRIFLFNMFKDFPELRYDFPTPNLAKGILGKLGFAFFGGKNTTVRFHYDIDCSNVLMTQLIGRKRVILIPPIYDQLIYKIPYSSFSMIDPDRPNYNKFPGLRYVEGYDFILQPGDALFMPTRYWHYNTYLEGGMAVSYRILAQRPVDLLNGLMNTTFRLAYDKIMNSVFGERWMNKKVSIAMKRADQMIGLLSKESKEYRTNEEEGEMALGIH